MSNTVSFSIVVNCATNQFILSPYRHLVWHSRQTEVCFIMSPWQNKKRISNAHDFLNCLTCLQWYADSTSKAPAAWADDITQQSLERQNMSRIELWEKIKSWKWPEAWCRETDVADVAGIRSQGSCFPGKEIDRGARATVDPSPEDENDSEYNAHEEDNSSDVSETDDNVFVTAEQRSLTEMLLSGPYVERFTTISSLLLDCSL